MYRTPLVRMMGPSVYVWKSTKEADRVAEEIKRRSKTHALPHQQVHQQAVASANQLGLEEPSQDYLRGLYQIQFGKYQGQTFRWLVENDMGYTTYLLCQVETEGGNTGPGPLNDNKRQLKMYMESFPYGRDALEQRRRQLAQQRERRQAASRASSAASPPGTPTVPSKMRRIHSPTAADEMEDTELLTQVETLEASLTSTQSDDALTTPRTPAEQSKATQPLSQKSASLLDLLQQPEEFPLPAGWAKNIPEEDQKWISRAICRYDPRGKLEVLPTQLWYHPPQPHLIPSQCPFIDRYFAHSLFVWMPKLLWRVRLHCVDPGCDRHELARAGTYKVVRKVISVDSYYLMVTERYECTKCKAKYVGWSGAMVSQLDISRRVQFPVLLTYRYACDESVVSLMRNRGIGNSATQLQKKLEEQHCRKFLGQTAHYLSDCKGFAESRLLMQNAFVKPPGPISIPKPTWFQHVYSLDVMSRIDEVLAAITSTFGRILKMDSTKKVAKKLAGSSRGMAAWATNVGNEDGLVLNSVLTCEEGHFGLQPMVDGIVGRYKSAGVPAPEALYVDRDCCGESFTSKLFSAWPDLEIRLDIWHFMRRFSAGCTTDAHQLYGEFMRRISKCIFEWSKEDLHRLRDAKRSELQLRGVSDPSDEDVLRWLTKNELKLHCRRRTRGTQETTRLLEELLETLHGPQGLDTLGVPLFDREKMVNIWESQKRHVKCIQDPDGISLYTETGTVKKGGVSLPTFRCARGSVSLESFHNHLAKFIPGTTASESHFQAFLLEGLRRWNEDRVRQATGSDGFSTYSGLLRHAVNDLSQTVLKETFVPEFKPPRKYTGEKVGVEYLFNQTGKILQDILKDPDNEDLAQFDQDRETADGDSDSDGEDEGFEDANELEDPTLPPVDVDQLRQPSEEARPIPAERSTTDDRRQERLDSSDAVDANKVGGFGKVDRLAEYLYSLRDQTEPISEDQASRLIGLWNALSDFDKQPTVPSPRHQSRLTKGSVTTFKVRSKASCVPGVDSVKRAFHGAEGGIAQRPDSNRIMELIIIKLCSAYPSPRKEKGTRVDRWSQVSRAYRHIRELFLACRTVQEATSMVLFEINHATLTQWFTKRTRDQERNMLLQNLRLGEPPMVAETQLPPAKVRDPLAEGDSVPVNDQHQFPLPPYTVGTSGRVRRRQIPVSESPADPESSVVRVPLPTTVQPLPAIQESRGPVPLRAILPRTTAVLTPEQDLPRSTLWYRRKQEKRMAAGENVRRNKVRRAEKSYKCGKCGQPRAKDTHTQFKGHWFCKVTAPEGSYPEWRSSVEKRRQEKMLEKKK